MKPLLFLTILCGWLGSQLLYSQDRKVTLRKNRHQQAKILKHHLNDSRDSLLLNSDSKIDYIYTINRAYKREVNTYIFDTEYALPLDTLSAGKHVVVVGQKGLKIVFTLFIEEDLSQARIVATNAPKED